MKYTRHAAIFAILATFLFAALPSAQAGESTTVTGYIASVSEELLDKAISYSVAKDQVALNKLIASGRVIWLKGGIKVQIVDTKIFKGKVKVRPIGETFELWTVSEAVK
jgi:hypothetical protein